MVSPGDEHYAAVGRVASSWALFEAVIDSLVSQVSYVHEETAACITSQISGHARKLDALIALVRLARADKKTISQFCEISDRARGISERRNRIVHDTWDVRATDGAGVVPRRFEASARKALRYSFFEMSTDQVRQVELDTANLMGDLVMLVEAFQAQRSA